MRKMTRSTSVILIVALVQLTALCSARIPFLGHTSNPFKAPFQAFSPLNPPQLAPHVPPTVPAFPPSAQPPISPGYVASPPRVKHHKRPQPIHALSPSFSPPQAGCDEILCSEPLTATPIGSPCGCVFPIRLTMDLNVAPYLLFTHIAELEMEIASGTFLKQSQVKIMAAVPSLEDQQKTRVTVYLVPLREKFDDTTSLLIYERVWQKQVPVDETLFGDYQVVSVDYPGLPSSPPSVPDQSRGFLGPGTGPKQRPLTADISGNSKNNKNQKLNAWIITVITVSSCGLVLACAGVTLLVMRWRNLRQAGGGSVGPTVSTRSNAKRSAGLRSTTLSTSIASSSISLSATSAAPLNPSVRTFSLADLSAATADFSPSRLLGQGGFGKVFRGILPEGSGGSAEVAVKLLTREGRGGDREFVAEVEMLSRLHHRNLVKLVGICIEGRKRCLVYELIRNGSVDSHLHGADKKKGLLDWDARMKIALGAARGLAYLHEDSNPRVIHRDFKASNILLEDDFTPKVTDFGLAREAPEGTHHISTRVMGTFGYVAPEYAMTGHVLVKSDVYSYGVVLLELLSGRKPVYISQSSSSDGPENLVVWARSLLGSKQGLQQLIDPDLNGNYDFEDVAKVASIASMCVHAEVAQRPFMGEVVQALKLVYNDCGDDECSRGEYDDEESNELGFDESLNDGWWNNESPFITMDCYSSGGAGRSVGGSGGNEVMSNRSGPLRSSKRKKRFESFYRLRGSLSDHADLPKHSSRLRRTGS
ncbi:hypothetical protein LUZ60_006814 [Juncus effusus]|nr:hypothetical protein LUZ60_006814 [Juncus effusus]